MMILLLFAASTLLVGFTLLERYLGRLPHAPLCPGCRALTSHQHDCRLVAMLLPILAATVVRECGRCGWKGRMRLRLASEGARRG